MLIGTSWGEVTYASKYLTMKRTDPQTRNYPAPNIYSAEVEKPDTVTSLADLEVKSENFGGL